MIYYLLHISISWWGLSGSKSPQFSRTLLSILTVFNNDVVWMVSTRPPTFKSCNPFNNPLVTVVKAPITIGIMFTFMLYCSLARSRYLSFISISLSFILWSARTTKLTILQVLFFLFFSFLLITIRSCLLAEIMWSVCMSKSHWSLCVILQDRCWIVPIRFVRMVKFQFLAHLPVDYVAHPVVSSLIFLLCKFAAFAYHVIDGFVSTTT